MRGWIWLILQAVHGIWRRENSHTNPDKYRGFGRSIMLQGAALFLFDAIMFTTHNRHGKKMVKLLDAVQLAPNSLGLKVVL